MRKVVVALLCAGLAACASAPHGVVAPPRQAVIAAPHTTVMPAPCQSPYAAAQEDTSKRGDYVAGGLYRPAEQDRVPLAIPDIACIPEPAVVALPRSRVGNRPVYSVLDREYRVLDDTRGYVEEGLASYYGEKFHGRRTSNLEVYDMYAFSAAHKTLPLPSFARVTSLDTGRSVVVRVNDRGPFHDGRVMDLSLAAAVKLGIYPRGTGRVRVEALQPGDDASSRYAMQPAANAARFDGWMQQRGVRIATGRPMPVGGPMSTAAMATAVSDTADPGGARPVASAGTSHPDAPARLASTSPAHSIARSSEAAYALAEDAPLAAAQPLSDLTVAPIRAANGNLGIAAAASAPAAAVLPMPAPRPAGEAQVVLQVASFATRDNAERNRERLQQAGVDGAQVLSAQVGGQTIWRVRVGPVPVQAEPDLVARLAALGFASARRARD